MLIKTKGMVLANFKARKSKWIQPFTFILVFALFFSVPLAFDRLHFCTTENKNAIGGHT